jgi:hypothetical protein
LYPKYIYTSNKDASEPGSDEIGGGIRLNGADLRQMAVIEEPTAIAD